MNLILPIEIKKRELEAKILLGLTAAESGFDVLLGEKGDVNWVASDLRNLGGIILHKDISPVKKRNKFLKKVIQNGFVNSVQDEESGLLEKDYNDFALKRFSFENADLTHYIFCWGKRDFNYFQDIFKNSLIQPRLTGSPRVDLWRKNFDRYYHVGKSNDYILIVSNFGHALGRDRFSEKLTRAAFKDIKDNISYGRHVLRYQSFQAKTVEKLILFILDLNDRMDGYEIIIRPHPIDDPGAWVQIFNGYKKIRIVSDGPLTPLVRNAKALVHNGCTTGLEAFVSEVPSYSFCPYGSWKDTEYADRFSVKIKNVDEFISSFNQLGAYEVKIHNERPGLMNMFNERVFINEDQFAADIIVDEFKKGYVSTFDVRLQEKLNKIRYVNWKRYLIKKLRDLILNTLGRGGADMSFKYPEHSFEEVKKIADGLSSTLNRFEEIGLFNAGPKSVMIVSKNKN